MAGITSTNFIKGAGLKKWIPTQRFGFFNADAMDAMDKLEVLDAIIQSLDT